MSKAKVLVVTSGKGGVGKTTSTAALGAALGSGGAECRSRRFRRRSSQSRSGARRRTSSSSTTSRMSCRILPNSRSP